MLLTIKSFHKSIIKFTVEIEQNSMIPFLNVLLIRTQKKIHTTIQRKNTKLWLVEHMRHAKLMNI